MIYTQKKIKYHSIFTTQFKTEIKKESIMLIKKLMVHLGFIVSISASNAILPVANAEPYSPYPAILAAKLIAVRSASTIDLSADTWPGFNRTFSISLAGVEIPQNSPDVKLCQQKLAEQALIFVKEYLKDAAKIEIHNMTMQTSSNQNAEADIYTEKGSLTKALTNNGFARSTDIDHEEPWC